MDSSLFQTYLWPFIACAGFVTLNEMGDKTQLLAMAFATRMKFLKVMLGVLIATVLNHALAVTVGTLLARVPGWQGWIQLIAASLFIIFGLWALVPDKADDASAGKSRFGDVATVAAGFFIAEMGDKTQLATIALSAKYPQIPVLVLAGTTTGMLIADGLGIFVGNILNRKLPDHAMKFITSAAFILFGLISLWQSLGMFRLSPSVRTATVCAILLLSLVSGGLICKKVGKRQ